jgi:hypothetical protein
VAPKASRARFGLVGVATSVSEWTAIHSLALVATGMG